MKPTRWTFYFDQGHLPVECRTDFESQLITDALESGTTPIICVPSGPLTAYVNLQHVKCVTREEVPPAPVIEPEVIA